MPVYKTRASLLELHICLYIHNHGYHSWHHCDILVVCESNVVSLWKRNFNFSSCGDSLWTKLIQLVLALCHHIFNIKGLHSSINENTSLPWDPERGVTVAQWLPFPIPRLWPRFDSGQGNMWGKLLADLNRTPRDFLLALWFPPSSKSSHNWLWCNATRSCMDRIAAVIGAFTYQFRSDFREPRPCRSLPRLQ